MNGMGVKRALGITLLLAACARDNPEFGLGADGGTGGGEGTGGTTVATPDDSTGAGSGGGSGDGTTSHSDEESGTDDVGGVCVAGELCLDVPEGWNGPVAIESGSNVANKLEPCAHPSLSGFIRRGAAGPVMAPECCACFTTHNECGVQVETFGGRECISPSSNAPVTQCSGPPTVRMSERFTFSVTSSPGSCDTMVLENPPAIPASVKNVCRVPDGTPCAGGQCVPDGVGDGGILYPCIVRGVDDPNGSTCPEGWSPHELIRDITSNFDCSTAACECEAVPGTLGECNPALALFESDDCSGAELDVLDQPGACMDSTVLEGVSSLVGVVDPGPLCVPQARMPAVGDFDEDNWAQICCRP